MLLNFIDFINRYFPYYKMDADNKDAITLLGLWAMRDRRYEDTQKHRYLEKGICLSGNVGTGKTELMYMLQNFLRYIQSPYCYKLKVVWDFADKYKSHGTTCFDSETMGNNCYDELLLINEVTNRPDNEYVSHYGDKILIGEKLIHKRYNSFKNFGYQSHFTTNANYEELKLWYGVRAFSRLCEMCAIIPLLGENRRFTTRPTFHNNMNEPTAPLPTSVVQDESVTAKQEINAAYRSFIETGKIQEGYDRLYVLMGHYGAPVATEAGINEILTNIYERRKHEVSVPLQHPGHERRRRSLCKQYEIMELDTEERTNTWTEAKVKAVYDFFKKCKEENRDTIFEM